MVIPAIVCAVFSLTAIFVSNIAEAADNRLRRELLGAPVYTAEGDTVGVVTHLRFDMNGEPVRITFKGEATNTGGRCARVLVAKDFISLRGAIVLNSSSSNVLGRQRCRGVKLASRRLP